MIADLALALVGPAIISAAQTLMEQVNKHISSTPQTDNKGSVNLGGGGGGSGSGCGKAAPCDKAKKKTKSCGGGGGSCGKSKSCGGRSVSFKVCFKDFYGKAIKVDGNETQSVEKESSAKFPWYNETDIPEEYKVSGYTFSTWSPYPSSVTQDMECISKWYNNTTGELIDGSIGNTVLVNKVSEEVGQTIQDFNDEYLAPSTTKSLNIRTVTQEGKFNVAIDTLIERMDYVTKVISDDMDILWEIKDTCTNWPVFNDTKKCLLNIQSCFIFQTRMTLNLDFRYSMMKDGKDTKNPDSPETSTCIYDRIMNYTQNLLDTVRNGEEDKIYDMMDEYRLELDDDIDYYLENNEIALNDFKESYNIYVDTINSCFPTDPLKKI